MSAAGGVSQGSFGFCKLNSTVVLIRPGASLAEPRNLEMPHPINGSGYKGIFNKADGLHFPVVNIPTVPMDIGAASWLTAANLNAFFITKAAFPSGDLGELTNLYLAANGIVNAGATAWKVNKAKGAGFTLVIRKGQPVGMNLSFHGRSRQKAVSGDRPTSPLAGSPLMFDRLSLGTELDGKGIVGVTLQYNTGLTPNMELDGTLMPVEHNAGLPSCSVSIEYNALDAIAPLGYDSTNDTWQDEDAVDFSLLVDSTTPTSLVFTMARLVVRNPFDMQTQANRVQRSLTYDVIGTASQNGPLAIA